MHITFISIGKTTDKLIADQCAVYCKRIVKYTSFTWKETADIKSLPPAEAKIKEGSLIFNGKLNTDFVFIICLGSNRVEFKLSLYI